MANRLTARGDHAGLTRRVRPADARDGQDLLLHWLLPGAGVPIERPDGLRADGDLRGLAVHVVSVHGGDHRRCPGLAAARMAMSIMAFRRCPRSPGSGGCRTVTR